MLQNSAATPRGVVARARTARPLRWRRPFTALALALGLALAGGSTPKAAYADPGIEVCIAAVHNAVDSCMGDDAGWIRKSACQYFGGVAIMGCVLMETTKLATRFLPNVF